MTKLHELAALGQALWFDFIRRSLITSGELQALVEQGVRGVTSNPSIFEKAIAGSRDYDDAIAPLVKAGLSIEAIYESLAIADIQRAADILRPLYDASAGLDGYVSLEVSPALAHDTANTVTEARRLFATLARPNVLIKVPATPAGIPAVKTLIGDGININVTLMFSVAHYEAVARAYIAGLENLAAAGGDLRKVASVASIFVSRVDTLLDKQLPSLGVPELCGKIAVANAKVIYTRFKAIFSGPRWEALAAKGARVQRPLWASTGVKNPAYPDTLYVDALIGANTVNTAPPDTIQAFLDHGTVGLTVETGLDAARAQLARLAEVGVNLDQVMQGLQDAGVAQFAAAFDSLLASIAAKHAL